MEQQVTGNVIAAIAGNQSDLAYVASCLDVPRDLVQAILRVAGKALLLLG